MKLALQSLSSPKTRSYLCRPSDPPFPPPLFSYSYESFVPQPLSFHIDLNPPRCGSHASTAHSCNPANPLFPIPSLQPPQFHAITHSFAQRRTTICPVLSSFRTLSIATGVVSPCMAKYLNVYFNLGDNSSGLAYHRKPRSSEHPDTPTLRHTANVPTFRHSAKIHATPL